MRIENSNYSVCTNNQPPRRIPNRWMKKINDTFERCNPGNKITITNPNLSHEIEYNGKDTAFVYKKTKNKITGEIEKIKFEVGVGKKRMESITTYYLFDKKSKKEIGWFQINDWGKTQKKPHIYEILKNESLELDYPEEGLFGDRISIEYLKNNYPEEYCGIGEACDQIAIEYCLKESITPQIISEADPKSIIAHYKRGRRFLPATKNSKEYIEEFGTNDINKIIEKRIKETPHGEDIYCEDLGIPTMYMPKEVVAKYLERIKENPILH